MKSTIKRVLFLTVLLFSTIVLIVSLHSTKELSSLVSSIEAMTRSEFTNECPGAQGSRQQQAVGCFDDFWGQVVTQGCCYGGSIVTV